MGGIKKTVLLMLLSIIGCREYPDRRPTPGTGLIEVVDDTGNVAAQKVDTLKVK